jgi:hypothetical protein
LIYVLIHQRNLIWADCPTLATNPSTLATLPIDLGQDVAARVTIHGNRS